MINIKAIAIATDGAMKRLAVTYDTVNDEGKITTSNAKLNRVIIDDDALKAVETLNNVAQKAVEESLTE